MDAGWVKIKTLCSTKTFAQDRGKIESLRKIWTSRLTELNVDFQFVIENDGTTYELNLYVRNIDELRVIDFVENYEERQTNEEAEKVDELEQIEENENLEENIINKDKKVMYFLGDVKTFIIIFSLISISFSILAIIYGFQIINKLKNGTFENIIIDVTYLVVFIVVTIFSIIADIRFCKKAKELEENGDK